MLILLDAKSNKGIQRIAGFCPDGADFIDLVNDAQERLIRRGDFLGTLVPIYVCVRGGCVVWPRYVANVRALADCRGTIQPANIWGDYLPRTRGAGWRQGLGWRTDCERVLSAHGFSSVYQDIQGEGRTVRAYVRCQKDLGKTVTVFGTDNNGQPLQQRDPAGNWTMGQVLTLQNPFASTNTFVRHIDYVLKDETQCPISLFAYNATGNVLEPLAIYDGSETRPSYERTRLQGWGSGGCCSRGISALVKLRFIPAKTDTDLLLIDNLAAIKYEMQAIKAGEAGDRNTERLREADAVKELNLQLADESPEDQFSAVNRVFGDRTFANHCF